MLRDSERADDLNDRANTFFGYVLLGKADTGDLAEYERSARALQDELTLGSPYPDAAYPDLDARYDSALAALRDAWRDEQHASTDHLYPSTDAEALEAWEEARARDFDVTDEVPY